MCLLSHISPLEHLFVLKILSRSQWATEVQKFVGFCEGVFEGEVAAVVADRHPDPRAVACMGRCYDLLEWS